MTKRDFAALACKLLAVYFFVRAIGLVPSHIYMLFISYKQAARVSLGWFGFIANIVELLNIIILLGISYLLWFKARQCAERIFPEDSSPAILVVDSGFLPMALALTGVIVLVLILPHLLSLIVTYLKYPDTLTNVDSYELMKNRMDAGTSIFRVLFGIWLIFGAGNISRIIKAAICATQDQKASSH